MSQDVSSSSVTSRFRRSVRLRKRCPLFRTLRNDTFGGEKVCALRHRGARPVLTRPRTVAHFTATRRRRFLCSRGRALLRRVTLVRETRRLRFARRAARGRPVSGVARGPGPTAALFSDRRSIASSAWRRRRVLRLKLHDHDLEAT